MAENDGLNVKWEVNVGNFYYPPLLIDDIVYLALLESLWVKP